jgi:hypothetical protein
MLSPSMFAGSAMWKVSQSGYQLCELANRTLAKTRRKLPENNWFQDMKRSEVRSFVFKYDGGTEIFRQSPGTG